MEWLGYKNGLAWWWKSGTCV